MDRHPIAAELQSALALQRQAHRLQPMPSLAERQHDLSALRRMVIDNVDALCDAISTDYGFRSRHETLLTEVAPALQTIDHALKHLGGWMKPQRRAVDRVNFGLASNRVLPQPLGVVGVIVPWNFPLNLSVTPLAAVFAAGNRALVKMSENSRHLTQLLVDKLPAYLPPEKLKIFAETGAVGTEFSKLPFNHLFFTGSGETGRAVMAAAAHNLCPVTLELGGKSPAVVCDDYPLRKAVDRILYAKCLNAGQICITVDHAYVPRAKVAEFVRHARDIVQQRYATLDSPDYTAIIDQRAFDRLSAALDEARARGAEIIPLLPGAAADPARRKLAPHLVLGLPDDCALMQREIFGPVLPVLPYDSLQEVIDRIQAQPSPLALYPFTHDRARADHLVSHVLSGGVSINDTLFHNSQHDLPFGGVGGSGMGHYHGREGFETFSKMRPIFRQARWSAAGLLAPPYGKFIDRALARLVR